MVLVWNASGDAGRCLPEEISDECFAELAGG